MRKKWKIRSKRLSTKALVGALAIAQAFPLSAGYAATRFADVQGHWAEPAISALAELGIVRGKTPTTFNPDDDITRAEFITILVRSLNLPVVKNAPRVFEDVKPDFFAYDMIQTAYQHRLVSGTSPSTFSPNEPISRQDMAAMITNALQIQTVPPSFVQTSLSPFVDNGQISDYARKAAAVASYLGVVRGDPDKKFNPLSRASRADAAAMIQRMRNLPEDKLNKLKDMANPVLKRIELGPNPVSLYTGETQQFTANVYDSNGERVSDATVTWSVYGDIGTVNGQGLFTATGAGSGTVTATAQLPGQSPVSATVNVTVETPKRLAFAAINPGSFKPAQPISFALNVKDDKGEVLKTDNGRALTVTVNGPDGTSSFEVYTLNGQASFTLNKTKAGSYTVTVSGRGTALEAPATFTIVPGDLAKLNMHVAPSPFVQATHQAELRVTGLDAWENAIPSVPVTFSLNDPNGGTLGATGDPMTASFTAGKTKGFVTVTAKSGSLSVSRRLTVYTSAADLVSGKGDWMMWRDWKNYPVKDTLQRFKDAGVTHVYLLVSTTNDGFFGQDSMDDFLHQAHDAGIAVIGWVYAAAGDPWKDAEQTIRAMQYTTPTGDRFDALAADLEENLDTYHQEEFAKSVRNALGAYYPMIAVIYPATWRPNQPWDVYSKYYDVVAPMVYWHYKAKPYTYKDAYDAVGSEMVELRKKVGQNMPIHIIGQSYNMFPKDWSQHPTPDEIRGAMQATKEYGAVGYSTYRGREATSYGWSEFAKFEWPVNR